MMRNPAGRECKHFYGDYHRGKNREECRLLSDAGLTWKPEYCNTCPVPDILLANSCQHMKLIPKLIGGFWFLRKHVNVGAYCEKTNLKVDEPKRGCGECVVLPDFIVGTDDDSDTST